MKLDWQTMFELRRYLGWSFSEGLSQMYPRGLNLGGQKGAEQFEVQDFPLQMCDGHNFLQQLNWSRELRLWHKLKSYDDFLHLDRLEEHLKL